MSERVTVSERTSERTSEPGTRIVTRPEYGGDVSVTVFGELVIVPPYGDEFTGGVGIDSITAIMDSSDALRDTVSLRLMALVSRWTRVVVSAPGREAIQGFRTELTRRIADPERTGSVRASITLPLVLEGYEHTVLHGGLHITATFTPGRSVTWEVSAHT